VLKNKSYKKKNQFLLIGAILLYLLLYNFTFKDTIEVYSNVQNTESQVELASNASMMVAQLEKQVIQIDAKIGNQNKEGIDVAQSLLELVTNYCQTNHAVLREFPKSILANQDDLSIETNVFVVEGNFATLINLVYLFEQKNKLGQIASVHYQFKKDILTKKTALTATIYLQNIKKRQNEK